MEPIPPNSVTLPLAAVAGVAVGVGAQILFQRYIAHASVSLTLLLLIPPLASLLFIRVDRDSVGEGFLKGFQLGTLAWFLVALASALW